MSRQLILDICQKEHINAQVLSRGWLLRLEKNGLIRYIFNNCFPLNPQSSGAIAADKFATFEVLHATETPVIDHAILYPFDNHYPFAEGYNTPEYLDAFFREHHCDIVIKPNHGLGGQGITHVTAPEQFPDALAAAFATSSSASLCPFYHIRREYRVIMLDDEARLVYGKERGADWRFNLQRGSKVIDVDPTSKLYTHLTSLASRAVDALALRFCSVDIIELDPSEPHTVSPNIADINHSAPEPTLLVIEVNSAVATTKYLAQRPDQTSLIEDIYRDALHKMFKP